MMKAVDFTPGGVQNLKMMNTAIPNLKEGEVLVKIYATAVNRADIIQRNGAYPPPPGESEILGLEAAGTIEKLSSEKKWKKGDRVMALLAGGGYAEYAAVHEDHLLSIPDSLSYTEAAAIPEVWLTAFQLLHFIGKARAGETVLIHAGSSGVGTAALQLCKLKGITSIATAGNPSKLEKSKELGASHAFNYKEGPWLQKVLNATSGKGVDVILDCIGELYWEQNLDALATEGRWVVYGLMGGSNVNGNMLESLLKKRATISGTTLRSRSNKYKAELVAAFAAEAMPHFATGALRPIVDSTMPLEKVAEAHSRMEANANAGKIVLIVNSEEAGKEEL